MPSQKVKCKCRCDYPRQGHCPGSRDRPILSLILLSRVRGTQGSQPCPLSLHSGCPRFPSLFHRKIFPWGIGPQRPGLPAWEINTSVSTGRKGLYPWPQKAPRHTRWKPELRCVRHPVSSSVCPEMLGTARPGGGQTMGSPLASQWQLHNCVCPWGSVWWGGNDTTLWCRVPVIPQSAGGGGGPAAG